MTLEGYKPKDLAEMLGVSFVIVYQWLRKERNPSRTNLKKLIALSSGKIDANTFL